MATYKVFCGALRPGGTGMFSETEFYWPVYADCIVFKPNGGVLAWGGYTDWWAQGYLTISSTMSIHPDDDLATLRRKVAGNVIGQYPQMLAGDTLQFTWLDHVDANGDAVQDTYTVRELIQFQADNGDSRWQNYTANDGVIDGDTNPSVGDIYSGTDADGDGPGAGGDTPPVDPQTGDAADGTDNGTDSGTDPGTDPGIGGDTGGDTGIVNPDAGGDPVPGTQP